MKLTDLRTHRIKLIGCLDKSNTVRLQILHSNKSVWDLKNNFELHSISWNYSLLRNVYS